MVQSNSDCFAAECFWPDVDDAALATLDRRIERVVGDLTSEHGVRYGVRYLGSILLREDEVVLCHFEGRAETVRDVAERAEIPFERLLTIAHSPWLARDRFAARRRSTTLP
jgi:hypothetical protein